jgi:hypothetical protein
MENKEYEVDPDTYEHEIPEESVEDWAQEVGAVMTEDENASK